MNPTAVQHVPINCVIRSPYRRPASALFIALLASTSVTAWARAVPHQRSGWKLTWHDEFERKGMNPPDPSKWEFDIGGGGWGNNELEFYTPRLKNAREQNGLLAITAVKEDYSGESGPSREYTSARLKTKAHFSQAYGRFEARIKLPGGKGIWPAFWMLGDNIDEVGWPSCGEIDILESIGETKTAYGTLHGPGYSGSSGVQGRYLLTEPKSFQDDFHLFAVEWEPASIRFYVDEVMYTSRTPQDLPPKTKWVFDHPFFILLNLAVGGNWPGGPDQKTSFPQSMLIDYVRVYKRTTSFPSHSGIRGPKPNKK